MSSIVKVDTIQENTSANGITVDGLNIKDSKLVTANSVVTSNITNDAVTIDKLNLISTSSAPSLEAKGDGSSQDGYIQLNCSQNSHGIKLKSPAHSANASYTLTFPPNDGDADQFLKTDGSGGLSFAAGGVNTPAFHAYRSGNQSISNGTYTNIIFNVEYFDTASAFNTSTGLFTVPSGQAGTYLFTWEVRRGDWHSNRLIGTFEVNGSDRIYAEDSGDGNKNFSSCSASTIFNLSVGDTVGINIYHNNGSSQNIGGATNQSSNFLTGMKLIT